MKKFLPYILIFTIIVGITIPNSTVKAACPIVPTDCVVAAVTAGVSAASDPGGAVVSMLGGVAGNIFAPVLSWLAFLIMKVLSLFLGLAGLLLNFVLKITIVDMAKNITGMTGINVAWKVLRDLMNITFIFMLVYEGILMIIGQSDVAKVRKFILGIVLASLLINFSLFFTKVIIDASNIVTIGLYNSILSDTNSLEANSGLSNSYMQSLGLQKFWTTTAIDVGGGNEDDYSQLTANIMASILIVITVFVFLAISVMFVVRYIVLILLLVLSPIAYMGMALPSIESYAKNWWKTLWGQVLFGPIYMLMTWVVLTLISSGNFTGAAMTLEDVTKNGTDISGSVNVLFNFAVIIGLTISSLIISKNFATQGAKQVGDLSSKATAFAGGALLGGAGRLGRGTVGRFGSAIADRKGLKDTAANGNIINRNLAKFAINRGNRAATATFDARATNAFGSLSDTTGVKFGKVDVKKENFRALREEQIKKDEERTKRYKPSDLAYADAKAADAKAMKAADNKITAAQTSLNQATQSHKEAEAEIEENEKKIEKMQKEAEETRVDELREQRLRDVQELRNQSDIKKKGLVDMRKIMSEKDKAVETAKKEKENYKKEEDRLNSQYQSRVEAEADRVENAGPIWRAAANVAGIATGSVPMTKSDRRALAHRIRAVPKGKSKISFKEFTERGAEAPEEPKVEAPAPAATPAGSPPAAPTT